MIKRLIKFETRENAMVDAYMEDDKGCVWLYRNIILKDIKWEPADEDKEIDI